MASPTKYVRADDRGQGLRHEGLRGRNECRLGMREQVLPWAGPATGLAGRGFFKDRWGVQPAGWEKCRNAPLGSGGPPAAELVPKKGKKKKKKVPYAGCKFSTRKL